MRIKFLITIAAIALLGGCTKVDAPINFNCKVNGNYISGTAVTYYTSPPTFQVTMTGPNNQAITLSWFNIDSSTWIGSHITPRTYTMSTSPLPPFTCSGTYISQYGTSTYATGSGSTFGGTITVTSNGGLGGLLSGTFSFTAQNESSPYDTVYITSGSFTNVRVGVE
jgi:hypothetical protein